MFQTRSCLQRGILCLLLGLVLPMLGTVPTSWATNDKFFPAQEHGVEGQYIVVLSDEAESRIAGFEPTLPAADLVAGELTGLYGGEIRRVWDSSLRGFVTQMDAWQAQRLAEDPAVKHVTQDRFVALTEANSPHCYGLNTALTTPTITNRSTVPSPQTITCDDPDPRNPSRTCPDNWGLDRIDQVSPNRDGLYNFTTTTNLGVHVYMIDTGAERRHEEFSVVGSPITRLIHGWNAIDLNDEIVDCIGHGTHVAGIIGGLHSGVAKEVWLHPVKYYDSCTGSLRGGMASHAMEALRWIRDYHDVATNGPAVVNWSGGNDAVYNVPGITELVQDLLAEGISFVQAAGNQDGEFSCTNSLGNVPGLESVLVAGATDVNLGSNPVDGRWDCEAADPQTNCGSNTGACIDIWAPGAHIVSAFSKDSTYNTNQEEHCILSGTSMAAPHVTGAVALYLADNPAATPAEVYQAIVSGGTCGVLDDNPLSPYSIGDESPNLLLNSLRNGGGCGGGPSGARLEWGTVAANGTPVQVQLTQNYTNPVVVATLNTSATGIPMVTRVSNVTASSFDVRIQRPGGGKVFFGQSVSYLVVEAGDWVLGGVKISASKYVSAVTDRAGSWVGEAQSYGQTFTNPVVLGQVMSENDPAFSVFWNQGALRTSPPSASALRTGKTVCEDTNIKRASETLGIIVIEAAHSTLGGVEFEAALGADIVGGVDNAPPYDYTFSSSFSNAPSVALATMAGVDGGNGGWAVVYGKTATSLSLFIDEDTIGDAERSHTTEQVAYLVFAGPGVVSQ